MFKWFKDILKNKREVKRFKQMLAQQDFDKLQEAYQIALACKHAERLKISLDGHLDEVTCLHCGLVKILPKRVDKL